MPVISPSHSTTTTTSSYDDDLLLLLIIIIIIIITTTTTLIKMKEMNKKIWQFPSVVVFSTDNASVFTVCYIVAYEGYWIYMWSCRRGFERQLDRLTYYCLGITLYLLQYVQKFRYFLTALQWHFHLTAVAWNHANCCITSSSMFKFSHLQANLVKYKNVINSKIVVVSKYQFWN